MLEKTIIQGKAFVWKNQTNLYGKTGICLEKPDKFGAKKQANSRADSRAAQQRADINKGDHRSPLQNRVAYG